MKAWDINGKAVDVAFDDGDPYPIRFASPEDAKEYQQRRGWTLPDGPAPMLEHEHSWWVFRNPAATP